MNMNNREIGIMLASFIIISLVAFLIIINITKEKDLSVSIIADSVWFISDEFEKLL